MFYMFYCSSRRDLWISICNDMIYNRKVDYDNFLNYDKMGGYCDSLGGNHDKMGG